MDIEIFSSVFSYISLSYLVDISSFCTLVNGCITQVVLFQLFDVVESTAGQYLEGLGWGLRWGSNSLRGAWQAWDPQLETAAGLLDWDVQSFERLGCSGSLVRMNDELV